MGNGNKIHKREASLFPGISVIIPVYQEGEGLNRTLQHLRLLPGGVRCEIIVVDGHPEESTLSVIDDRTVIRLHAKKGRGCQMNAAAQAASGEMILFLHADTLLPPGALSRIMSVMEGDAVVGGAFSLRIDSDHFFFRIIEWVTNLRARLTRVPYGDQGIFLLRDYFHEIGGFCEIPILEDVDLMRRIRKRGDRIVLLPEAVVTSSRRWDKEGLLYGTLRNRLIMMLYHLGIKPERLARFYS
jgi:rSAM/selenodomain-associated transferase 2